MVDKLRVVHPTDAERRVDDALPVHRCGDCPGYLLERWGRLTMVDKLRVVHPTDATRRVDDALPIHRCGDCSGYLLALASTLCLPQNAQTTRSPNPVRRPSGGAVERGVWHGCQTRNDGPGMAHRDDPRNSTGAREVWRSQTRMPGVLSLWLLSLCTSKEKVTRRKGETGRSGWWRK